MPRSSLLFLLALPRPLCRLHPPALVQTHTLALSVCPTLATRGPQSLGFMAQPSSLCSQFLSITQPPLPPGPEA
ncbi:hypothetical protein B0H67DRAFT_585300 [Lasiosphaeris hirsuta]|uniref:Uncharacterized protein n=1 Tax=Lasiosphaeris hirsuta TaxID=260670 RepID=A0AA40DTK5_9PEZI|nr:hypothetical protein B0H67DRAFT_585300 [Lasiosphaeris hirsuta]